MDGMNENYDDYFIKHFIKTGFKQLFR